MEKPKDSSKLSRGMVKVSLCFSWFVIRIDLNENNFHSRHEGPVWQIAWGHPRFGNILASCSYDCKVIIWKEQEGSWTKIKEYHEVHTASGKHIDNLTT